MIYSNPPYIVKAVNHSPEPVDIKAVKVVQVGGYITFKDRIISNYLWEVDHEKINYISPITAGLIVIVLMLKKAL